MVERSGLLDSRDGCAKEGMEILIKDKGFFPKE